MGSNHKKSVLFYFTEGVSIKATNAPVHTNKAVFVCKKKHNFIPLNVKLDETHV